jgi:hypothetical protein
LATIISFEMKVVKILVAAAVLLLGIYIALCFSGPREMRVSVEKELNLPVHQVRAWVTDFRGWEVWSPWRADSTMTIAYSGDSHRVGHQMAWTGEEMGAGSQTIAMNACDSVEMTLDFGMGAPTPSRWYFQALSPTSCKVIWTFDGGEIAFWNRGLMAILDPVKMISQDYEKGLVSLEKAAEQPVGEGFDPCAPVAEPAPNPGADGPISSDTDV